MAVAGLAAMNNRPELGQLLAWLPALSNPQLCLAWTLPQWELTIRLGRRLRLLARLAHAVSDAGLDGQIPSPARQHLLAERRHSQARTRAMTWALNQVDEALAGTDFPRVLLKGAAYVAQGLPNATGRLPSDLDILVPRAHLDEARSRLAARDWLETEMDTHDQRYYNEWSHEVPPMRHGQHSLELDLHHGILPPVARTSVDMGLILPALQATGMGGWSVLSREDQCIHCAVHLMFDSELRDRLRDLVDLDVMSRHFASDDNFWPKLFERAKFLGLLEPVSMASTSPVPGFTRQFLLPNNNASMLKACRLFNAPC